MRNIVFDKRSFAEFTQWALEDRKIHQKIIELIRLTETEIVIVSCKFHY